MGILDHITKSRKKPYNPKNNKIKKPSRIDISYTEINERIKKIREEKNEKHKLKRITKVVK